MATAPKQKVYPDMADIVTQWWKLSGVASENKEIPDATLAQYMDYFSTKPKEYQGIVDMVNTKGKTKVNQNEVTAKNCIKNWYGVSNPDSTQLYNMTEYVELYAGNGPLSKESFEKIYQATAKALNKGSSMASSTVKPFTVSISVVQKYLFNLNNKEPSLAATKKQIEKFKTDPHAYESMLLSINEKVPADVSAAVAATGSGKGDQPTDYAVMAKKYIKLWYGVTNPTPSMLKAMANFIKYDCKGLDKPTQERFEAYNPSAAVATTNGSPAKPASKGTKTMSYSVSEELVKEWYKYVGPGKAGTPMTVKKLKDLVDHFIKTPTEYMKALQDIAANVPPAVAKAAKFHSTNSPEVAAKAPSLLAQIKALSPADKSEAYDNFDNDDVEIQTLIALFKSALKKKVGSTYKDAYGSAVSAVRKGVNSTADPREFLTGVLKIFGVDPKKSMYHPGKK
jgi:hypothetical protein